MDKLSTLCTFEISQQKNRSDCSGYGTHNGHFYHSTGSDTGDSARQLDASTKIYRLHIKFNGKVTVIILDGVNGEAYETDAPEHGKSIIETAKGDFFQDSS
ncbi:XtrA/YqaO family protein [Bacillus sonorensis]|uniref:XtrA/YqaO family protein n=2 Tax=Bacillaceae TaxID=186817 RepID=UPI001B2AA4CB|nr:XtrA/YqaO family protein [Bacillus sonorensis]MDI3412227.1 XtrA/YqaO family protein [Bacillus sonorensis]MEC1441459.1 XtrA/YqaO family protein [Bacillus sonorensis]MEC1536073.1 XtrA/YqaO family protein [Bacillus sonorensis]GIN67427.1 hypothetical protein J41TS2_28480 [Bacillus sonorensis]